MIAIIGGLGAAGLWATATLCSSRSSRMLGSRVVLVAAFILFGERLARIQIVGVVLIVAGVTVLAGVSA